MEVIYSGGDITISQLILTDVTKQPYNEYLQENVLNPSGMTNSSFNQPPQASKEKILAMGCLADRKKSMGNIIFIPNRQQPDHGLFHPIKVVIHVSQDLRHLPTGI